MKSHYSILSAVVRPEIQEKISIGLLLVSTDELFFSFSKNKISVVRTLLDSSLYKFLNETIRQIDSAVSSENAKKETVFAKAEHSIQFSGSYLSYMNRYSNNLINFSEPVEIDLPANDDLYNFLFKKYIDASGSTYKKSKSVDKVKEEFYPKVKDYYNINKDITPIDIPNLLMSVNVDIIGKNEIPVFGQIIDFERQVYNIRQDVAALDFLMDAFDNGKFCSYLIGNEPNKTTFPKSHDAWADLRNWNKIINLPLDEIDRVKEYAEEHGVHPLFT
ncbi:MAG: hypothetical protein M0R39_06685 [Prolixibacteraceae bacterium]|nr:hypothetical protein [Prolixibacteraceae bacterium]